MRIENKPCLLLVADQDCETLKKTLIDTQNFVSSWVVFNPFHASQKEQIVSAINSVSLLPGAVISEQPWLGIGPFLEQAKPIAQQWATTMLWLKEGEELAFLSASASDELTLDESLRAAHILVHKSKLAYAELRLFSTQQDYLIEGEVMPVVREVKSKYCSYTTSIFGAPDRQKNDLELTLAMIEAQREVTANIELGLSAALLKLNLGNSEGASDALSDLDQTAEGAEDELRWLHHYLSGVALLAQNRADEASIWLAKAIDLNSERLEPYARLIETFLEQQQWDSAAQLANVATGLDWPKHAAYIEPGLYDCDFLALQLTAYSKANQLDQAGKIHRQLNSFTNKTNSVKAALTLFETAQEHARSQKMAEKSATNTPVVQPSASVRDADRPKLTIGMATYDDFDGVYFSLMSIQLFHADCLDDIELLVVDNNPTSEHGKAVKKLASSVGARYLAASEFKGTTVRERVFLEARGDFVMCIDCHVFLHTGVIARLLSYIEEHPNSKDIWHGPLVDESLKSVTTHMDERWQQCFYGVFDADKRGKDANAEPFEIPMQGLAMFVCKRTEWAGFNRKFRGFGGEEGYIHYKFALNGGRTLCLPFMRWTHRFPRPNGIKYSIRWEDRIRNYLIGWSEIGRDTRSIYDHFSQQLGAQTMAKVHRSLEAERGSPFWAFDSIYQLYDGEAHWSELKAGLCTWGLIDTVQKIPYKNTPESLTEALLRILNLAQRQGLPNVIVLTGPLPTASLKRISLTEQLSALNEGLESIHHLSFDEGNAGLLYLQANAYSEISCQWSQTAPIQDLASAAHC